MCRKIALAPRNARFTPWSRATPAPWRILLDQAYQRQLAGEEAARAVAPGVGPVEGGHPRTGRRYPVGTPVEVAPTPVVVRLPGGDPCHHHQRVVARRV